MRRPLPLLFLAVSFLLLLSGRARAQTYTFELINDTGLDPAEYAIYAMGFSTTSNLVLSADGTFVSQFSGTVSSYKVGTGAGEMSAIVLDSTTPLTGGRFYFFVVPVGDPAPSVPYGNQPTNPPDSSFPPFSIVELTVPSPNPGPPVVPNPATLDIQTVDGFIFPITITLNGQTNVAGQQYGQPVYASGASPIVNRAAIFSAYTAFMQNQGTDGAPYLDLTFGDNSFAGQPGGILNPGAFLTTVNSSNQYLNLSSPLNTAFNDDLNLLFSTATLKIQGVASGGGSGSPIATDTYSVTSTGNQTYPGTAVSLPALEFTGDTTPANVFRVFNPVGIAVLTDDAGDPIVGTIVDTALTLAAPVSGLTVGMYVSGAGLSPDNGASTTQITAIDGNVLTLNQNAGSPSPNSQYTFSKLPFLVMFQTPGQMVLANSGVFADGTVQFDSGSTAATVLGNLENQIVSALNRGVALNATALNPGTAGGTSAVWGDQRNWYPTAATQNLFSLFMHVGAISGTPIFFQPLNAAAWPNARNQVMGAAYGFAYDENGGPIPPAPVGQPEVPSKFDQNVPPGATVQITFGPWTAAAAPTPTPSPTPTASPTVKITGKKQIKTQAKKVKIKGTATGDELFVKYKKKPGKIVTKRIKIKASGKWVFPLKPVAKKTLLKFYAEDTTGARSRVQKVKVIDTRD